MVILDDEGYIFPDREALSNLDSVFSTCAEILPSRHKLESSEGSRHQCHQARSGSFCGAVSCLIPTLEHGRQAFHGMHNDVTVEKKVDSWVINLCLLRGGVPKRNLPAVILCR